MTTLLLSVITTCVSAIALVIATLLGYKLGFGEGAREVSQKAGSILEAMGEKAQAQAVRKAGENVHPFKRK